MARADVLDILRSRQKSISDFHFDNLCIPPINCYLSQEDIDALRKIATSARLSSKINVKYSMIDNIMRARGFKLFSSGTNRVVYKFLEDNRFLVKIALDRVGMKDNPLEYKNQFLLKPYVSKMFYTSPCGTVGFAERVLPVKNKAEFKEIASDVFDVLVHKILGLYVVEDVGTKYFMNWGIRAGFGPVLLDYPYVYKLDGNKLFCNWVNPDTKVPCDGEIDYDEGFNHLVCSKCGKVYLATDLRDNSENNNIVIKKGGSNMNIRIRKGDTITYESTPSDNVMVKPKPKKEMSGLEIRIRKSDGSVVEIGSSNEQVATSNEQEVLVSANTQPTIEVPSNWATHPEEEDKPAEDDKRQKIDDFAKDINHSSFIPEISVEQEAQDEEVNDEPLDNDDSDEQDYNEDSDEERSEYSPDDYNGENDYSSMDDEYENDPHVVRIKSGYKGNRAYDYYDNPSKKGKKVSIPSSEY